MPAQYKCHSTPARPCRALPVLLYQSRAVLLPVPAAQVPAATVLVAHYYQYQHLHQTTCKPCRSETRASPPSQFLSPKSLGPCRFFLCRRIPGARLALLGLVHKTRELTTKFVRNVNKVCMSFSCLPVFCLYSVPIDLILDRTLAPRSSSSSCLLPPTSPYLSLLSPFSPIRDF